MKTPKYKSYIVVHPYVDPKQYKQLLKHIGSQAFSRFVREKIQEELDSIHLKMMKKKK